MRLLIVLNLLIFTFVYLSSRGIINFYIVASGSMSPAVKPGSLILTYKQLDYKIGDIITFKDLNSSDLITHRIINADFNKHVYITKGDSNAFEDSSSLSVDAIKGKVYIIVPYIGYILPSLSAYKLPLYIALILSMLWIVYDFLK